MNHPEWIAILDYGSQVTQLIARRIREQKVYCEIIRFDTSAEELKKRAPKGIILSGGPCSVPDDDSPQCDPALFDLGIQHRWFIYRDDRQICKARKRDHR